jgi:hypothetical protein
MERTDMLMSALKLYGMRAAYDEVMTTGIKRRHEPPRIIGDLLSAEIAEKQARSIKYQLTIAKLPLAKDLDDFDFTDTPIFKVVANAHLGRLDEARAELRGLLAIDPKLTIAAVRVLFASAAPESLELYVSGLRLAGLPEE